MRSKAVKRVQVLREMKIMRDSLIAALKMISSNACM